MTDDQATLVGAAVRGDRSAMDQLLRLHYDRMYAVCRRITGNDADAADATQEAMISVVRSLTRFDGRSSFGTWVYRIATNASLDELRRRGRRPRLADRDTTSGDGADAWSDHDARTADPDAEQRVDAIADRMAIDSALAKLPDDFRVPIVLRDVADFDYAEIASTLGIPVGTVKSRIARGRGALAQLLRDGNHEPPDERPTNNP
jgi:RNA polymerase sigma-70 factor (ECF subfamily)